MGALCLAGSQEACGAECSQQGGMGPGTMASRALALGAPEPCHSSGSPSSASSSATSGILHSLLLRWGCWGNSGCPGQAPSGLLGL